MTGDPIEIVGGDQRGKATKSTCTGVQMFLKDLDRGEAGDNVGLWDAECAVLNTDAVCFFTHEGRMTPKL